MTSATDIRTALSCGRGTCPCARPNGNTHCPSHPDRVPSLAITEHNGSVLVHCHSPACDQEKVIGALRDRGLWNGAAPERRIVATYSYTDENDAELFQVVRFERKDFRQRHLDGNGGWVWNVQGVRRVLYRLPEVLAVARAGWRVYVVEGERDADALNALGLCATTCPHGAGKWKPEYADSLAGAEVVVIADKDGPGRLHAQAVAASCNGQAKSVRVIEVPPDECKDISDWLSAGATKSDIEALADAAPEWRPRLDALPTLAPTSPVPEFHVVPIDEFAAVDEPGATALLGDGDNALIAEGGDFMAYGDGGAGKTTLFVDLACHLAAGDDWLGIQVARPVRVLLIENEGPRPHFRKKLRRRCAAWKGSPMQGRVVVLDDPWATLRLNDEGHRLALAASIRTNEIDVVIIGPVTRSGMDEAGTLQEVRDFMLWCDEVRRASGRRVSFGLVHHENKSGSVSGAWEGSGDTLLHVQAEGTGHTRLFIQKARWASAYHQKMLHLAWTEGDGFELVEAIERTDGVIADEILASALEHGGGSWTEIKAGIAGKGDRLIAIRDRLLGSGRLINSGTEARKALWNADDPAAPQGPTSVPGGNASGMLALPLEGEAGRSHDPFPRSPRKGERVRGNASPRDLEEVTTGTEFRSLGGNAGNAPAGSSS